MSLRTLSNSLVLSTLVAALIAPAITFAQDSRPAPTAAEPVKDPAKAKAALARVLEKNAKKRDYTADMDMRISMMGMDIKSTGKMSVSKDGKVRQEISMQMPMMNGTMNQVMVNDGKTFWMLQDMPGGQKTVMKGTVEEMTGFQKKMGGGMPGNGGNGTDPAAQLEGLKEMMEFSAVEENVEVDGKPYWALVGELKPDAFGKDNPMGKMMGSMMKKTRVLFTKDDQFAGTEFADAAGKPIISMLFKNMNYEPKFDEKTFTFEPPAGVKVQNIADLMRNIGQMGMEDEEEEEEAAPAPASKPKDGK